jgi:hypothetical protein
MRKRRMRHPSGTRPRRALLQHLIDLLERESLGLGHEEEGEGEGDAAEGAPEEEDFGAEVGVAGAGADEVGRDDTDDLFDVR